MGKEEEALQDEKEHRLFVGLLLYMVRSTVKNLLLAIEGEMKLGLLKLKDIMVFLFFQINEGHICLFL